ncbi:MAG: biopolymer transporter ExbD [Sulfurospirillum sp.]|nr:biopolymer transporter ExbD [Campylobacteraceae bacterium]MBP9566700.1 biopolymer transporter ExbD [Sulfurospirillum sp.]
MIKYEQDDTISEINMTPFVDIVLVILVIFMATATFVVQGKIPLNLPHSSLEQAPIEHKKPLIVSVTQEGLVYLDDAMVDVEKLVEIVGSKIEENQEVILRSDAKTPFEFVVKVIEACKKNNIHRFAIQTKADPS